MLETLDTLIAFITVVLVLSLLVTGIVQVVQYTLRFRGRNLERGLRGLLASLLQSDAAKPPDAGEVKTARELAHRIVHDRELVQACQGRLGCALSRFLARRAGWLYDLTKGRTTWIEKEELRAALERAVRTTGLSGQKSALITGLDAHFDRWERLLAKRFQHRMRWVSLVASLGVVFIFQVDGFALLRDLSTNAELRNRLVETSSEMLEREAIVRELVDQDGVAGEALERWTAEHPDVDLPEPTSGAATTRDSVVAQLESALADRPDEERNRMIQDYRDRFDDVIYERQQRARELTEDVLGLSARMGLEPWAQGPGFYAPFQLARYLGVLVMVVLVSFGAPFWFNQLRNLVALRDLLKPREKDKPAKA